MTGLPDTTRTNHAEVPDVEERPAVVFDHVSLSFDDDVVLRDVSFTVPAGDMT